MSSDIEIEGVRILNKFIYKYQTNPDLVQKVINSLTSDPAVHNAILNNRKVRDLPILSRTYQASSYANQASSSRTNIYEIPPTSESNHRVFQTETRREPEDEVEQLRQEMQKLKIEKLRQELQELKSSINGTPTSSPAGSQTNSHQAPPPAVSNLEELRSEMQNKHDEQMAKLRQDIMQKFAELQTDIHANKRSNTAFSAGGTSSSPATTTSNLPSSDEIIMAILNIVNKAKEQQNTTPATSTFSFGGTSMTPDRTTSNLSSPNVQASPPAYSAVPSTSEKDLDELYRQMQNKHEERMAKLREEMQLEMQRRLEELERKRQEEMNYFRNI